MEYQATTGHPAVTAQIFFGYNWVSFQLKFWKNPNVENIPTYSTMPLNIIICKRNFPMYADNVTISPVYMSIAIWWPPLIPGRLSVLSMPEYKMNLQTNLFWIWEHVYQYLMGLSLNNLTPIDLPVLLTYFKPVTMSQKI